MSKLGKFIQSKGLENFDDGEEKAELVENECEATVVEVKGELVEAEIQVESANDAAQALATESAALEAYCDLLREAAVDGKMSPRAHQILTVGIESFTRYTGVVPKDFPTPADFGGRMSQRQAITISIESLSEVAKKTWEAFKLAMTALFQQLQDYATKLMDGSAKLQEKTNAMNETIRTLSGTPKVTEITIANGSPLAVNGNFVGQDTQGVAMLTGVAFNTYMGQMARYLKDIKTLIDGIKFDHPLDAKALGNAAWAHAPGGGIDGSIDSEVVEGDSRFPAGTAVKRSVALPGNMALYLVQRPPEAPSDLPALVKMLTDVKLKLLPIPDAAPMRGEVTVKVGTPQELNRRVTEMVRVVNLLNGKHDYSEQAKQALNGMLTSLDHLKQRADATKTPVEGAPASEVDASKIVSDFVAIGQNCQRLMGQDFQGVLAYCVRTLGAHLALIEKEVAAYQAPAAVPATAEPATA